MPEDEPTPSRVIPVLVAALVCDVAVAEPATGKKNLIGIFDRVYVGTFPTQRAVSLYLKLTDAEGFYNFEIRYVELSTNSILATVTGTFQLESRLASGDFVINCPPVPILSEGRYEFQIYANDTFIGSAFIDAIQRPQARQEG